jgi:hypothetical protein
MLAMLDDYIAHIKATHNKSLLARIYGIFTFKTNVYVDIDVMIMQNVATVGADSHTLKFDLKGSRKNRYSKLSPQAT